MATDAPNHEPVEPNSLTSPASPISNVVLLWIPLGAGQSVVRLSGKAFEALAALRHHRQRADLYHSALIVTVPEGRFVIEMTPVPDDHGAQRGVVGHGAVGMNWLGRLRVFRYENRCWPDGIIPDIPWRATVCAAGAEMVTWSACWRPASRASMNSEQLRKRRPASVCSALAMTPRSAAGKSDKSGCPRSWAGSPMAGPCPFGVEACRCGQARLNRTQPV